MNISFSFLPQEVYASTYTIPQLSTAVGNITDTITWIIGSVLVLLVIGFGIQFLLAADNPQERVRLRTKLIWALIGLFIIISAKPITTWLQSII